MKAVVQRVHSCRVTIHGELYSEIGTGLLVLLGVAKGDGKPEIAYMAGKVLNLRIFPDDEGRMNRSVTDIGGEIMVVSQFTLLGDTRKGRRPSFVDAEDPERAKPLYEDFTARLAESGLDVEMGVFGAAMNVSIENWGPVTLIL